MWNILAVIGLVFVVFYTLGAIGAGSFVVVYSPHKITYTIHKDAEKTQ